MRTVLLVLMQRCLSGSSWTPEAVSRPGGLIKVLKTMKADLVLGFCIRTSLIVEEARAPQAVNMCQDSGWWVPVTLNPLSSFLGSSEILMVHLCSTTFLLMRDKLKTAFELLELEDEPIEKNLLPWQRSYFEKESRSRPRPKTQASVNVLWFRLTLLLGE